MIDNLLVKIQALAFKNQDIEVIWLYGSKASDTAQEHSDYDLAIAFKQFNLPLFEKYIRPHELAIDWAQTLNLPERKISIVDINAVPMYLAYNIVEYGKVIYQTGTAQAYKEQNRIYSQYEYQTLEKVRYG